MHSIRCRARTAGAPAVAWEAWWADVSGDEVAIGGWASGRGLGKSREDSDERQSWDEKLHCEVSEACLVGCCSICEIGNADVNG